MSEIGHDDDKNPIVCENCATTQLAEVDVANNPFKTSKIKPDSSSTLQPDFHTDTEFDKSQQSIIKEDMPIILKWRDLELNKIFRVPYMEKKGYVENPNIVNLQTEEGEVFKVWIGPGTYEELRNYDLEEKIVFIKFDKVSN